MGYNYYGSSRILCINDVRGMIMKPVYVYWTPKINILVVECEDCEKEFTTPMNRWKITCPWCGVVGDMHSVRNELAAQGAKIGGEGLSHAVGI